PSATGEVTPERVRGDVTGIFTAGSRRAGAGGGLCRAAEGDTNPPPSAARPREISMSSHDPHGHGGPSHAPAPAAPSGPPTDWVMVRNVALLIALFVVVVAIVSTVSCRSAADSAARRDAAAFLDSYNREFRALTTASQDAEWQVNAKIVEG